MNKNLVFNENIANWIAGTLCLSNAYRISKTNDLSKWYKWKSGIVAPVYCNTRQLISIPTGRDAVLAGFLATLKEKFPSAQGVLGVATAGIGWSMTLGHLSNLPSGYIRTEPKAHGLGGLVEYYSSNAKKIVLIDDLIASGNSLKKAIDILRKDGFEVIGIISAINWNFEVMRENLEGIPVFSLCSYPQIIQQLELSLEEKVDLMNFYKHPSTHIWKSKLFAAKLEYA